MDFRTGEKYFVLEQKKGVKQKSKTPFNFKLINFLYKL